MILTDRQIREALASGEIKVTPFDSGQIQSASIDLRVGEEGATTKTRKRMNIRENGFLVLEPGDFGVISILEELTLSPSHVGRIGLRSKYARKGLIATTGPQIDPGYHGRLTLGVTNLTPKAVSIPYNDDILTLELHRLEEPSQHPYSGPYQDRLSLGPEDLESIAEGDGMAFSEVITTLRSLSANVGQLSSRMEALASRMGALQLVIVAGLAVIAVLVAVVGLRH
ncbi:MAG: dCTP deaminase [Caulobacteraceae bacterium]